MELIFFRVFLSLQSGDGVKNTINNQQLVTAVGFCIAAVLAFSKANDILIIVTVVSIYFTLSISSRSMLLMLVVSTK